MLQALDRLHDRMVALKVYPVTDEDRGALLEEARVLMRLAPHPSLPVVRGDFFSDDGRSYVIVMNWIDGQPRVPRALPGDTTAVAHGRALFNDPARANCASCHSGALFTNNTTVDVGTGRAFQVPSLVGIGTRGPFMHDGCAKTLADRFSNEKCGGGDRHGNVRDLTSNELADLVAFLQSI